MQYHQIAMKADIYLRHRSCLRSIHTIEIRFTVHICDCVFKIADGNFEFKFTFTSFNNIFKIITSFYTLTYFGYAVNVKIIELFSYFIFVSTLCAVEFNAVEFSLGFAF